MYQVLDFFSIGQPKKEEEDIEESDCHHHHHNDMAIITIKEENICSSAVHLSIGWSIKLCFYTAKTGRCALTF